MIPDHVAHLQVLQSNQVVRPNYAPRLLDGEVFTLPGYFKMLSGQTLHRLATISATLLFARHPPLSTLEAFFRLAQVAGVFHRNSVGVGVETFKPHIQTDRAACGRQIFDAVYVDAELTIVAIRPPDNPHSLNLVFAVKSQVTGTQQLESPDTKNTPLAAWLYHQ